MSIAEVVRDLHTRVGHADQSYSERQLYEAALDRLSRELAAVEGVEPDQATTKIEKTLQGRRLTRRSGSDTGTRGAAGPSRTGDVRSGTMETGRRAAPDGDDRFRTPRNGVTLVASPRPGRGGRPSGFDRRCSTPTFSAP